MSPLIVIASHALLCLRWLWWCWPLSISLGLQPLARQMIRQRNLGAIVHTGGTLSHKE